MLMNQNLRPPLRNVVAQFDVTVFLQLIVQLQRLAAEHKGEFILFHYENQAKTGITIPQAPSNDNIPPCRYLYSEM